MKYEKQAILVLDSLSFNTESEFYHSTIEEMDMLIDNLVELPEDEYNGVLEIIIPNGFTFEIENRHDLTLESDFNDKFAQAILYYAMQIKNKDSIILQ